MYLPRLPLEALRPCWSEPGQYVLIDDQRALTVSRLAAQAGVEVGMRSGGVATMAPQAVLLDRSPAKERVALDAVSLALLQFTPEVAAIGESGMLLDVTASLRLFGGHIALCRRIRAVVHALGFSMNLGCGPTAMGAWMLAVARQSTRHRPHRRAVKIKTLARRLDWLDCRILPSSAKHVEWFESIGCDTLGKLRGLPRAGLQRRTSLPLLDELDRAYGLAPELFEWVVPPATFHVKVELLERIEHADALLADAHRLILQLIGWLVAMKLAVTRLVLGMEHERGRAAVPPTEIELALAEPTWREEHLERLLKERLARISLAGPVIALSLKATQFSEMAQLSEALFPEPGGTPGDFARLMELLIARLGKENVLAHVRRAEHRPEVANCWLPAVDKRPKTDEVQEIAPRPFWLLAKPIELITRGDRPFYGSPLKVIDGPERIESGWWDDKFEARDYYVAQGSDSTCYWLYLERSASPRWFLHGLFG